MANVSSIKLPNNTTYNIVDKTSGYTKNTGTITKVQTTAGAHTTINVSSGAATFSVPTTAAHVGAIPTNTNGNTQNLLRPLQLNGLGDVTLDAKINTLRANRLAFLPAEQIIIEKTTDGGSTWTDAGVADSTKVGLFSETRAGVYIPLLNGVKNINCGLRITITGMKYNVPSGTAETSKYNYWNSDHVITTERYNQLKEMYFWVSSNSDSIGVKVERATGAASTNWITIFDNTNYGLTGWSGNDYIRFSQSVFGGGSNQTSNYWNYRLTFFTRGPGGSTTLSGTNTTSAQSIMEIRGYGDTWWNAGNEYAANDHLYTHDYLKNATFPAKVTATSFSGPLTGNVTGNVSGTASNVTGTVAIANGGTGQTTAANAINALLNGLPTWTADPTDTTYFIRQDTGGSATYGKVQATTLWNYISGKLPSWSKVSTKPSYNFSEIGSTPTTLSGYGITDAKIASGVITLGSNTITPLTSSSTLSAAKLSGAIPSTVTATTQASTDNSTKIATTAYVTTAIANLPEPMLFKGSVGTGGTVTSLPTAAAANEGWTYKVITALATPVTAEVGDTVISNGSEWVVIPSGDEPSGTVTSISAGTGLTTDQTNNAAITSSGTIKVKLNSETAITDTSKVYNVGVNSNGELCVKVSWSDIQTRTSDSGTERTIYLAGGTTSGDETDGLSKHESIKALVSSNTETDGYTILALGNRTSVNSAGAKYGCIRLYGKYNTFIDIRPQSLTNTGTIYLPFSGGTLVREEDLIPVAQQSSTLNVALVSSSSKSKFYDSHGGLTYTSLYFSDGSRGASTLTLGNNIATGTESNARGHIRLYGDSTYYTNIDAPNSTATRTITLPDKTGTVALTSDLPDVSGKIDTAGTGLSKSGTTLNHSNSVTAQTTQAVYPIKIDAQGHISAYGNAVTIPTIPSNNVTGSGSTDYLARWSGTNTLSSSHLSTSTSYNSSSDLYGKAKFYIGDTGQIDWQGQLVFYSGNLSKTITVTPPSLTTKSRTLTLPDASGTIALTSDIPTVNNATLTIQKNGTTVNTFTANASSNVTANISVPTKVSDLTNDSGFITASHTSTYSLPLAASGTRGGVQIGYSESGTNYAVKLSSEKMYVSVPWTDTKVTNTTATAATTYYLTGSTSNATATGGLSKHASLAAYTTADTATSGYTQLRLGNTTVTSSAGGKEGQIRLYGTTATYYVDLKAGAPSANRTITLPNKTGTIALTSDIPTATSTPTASTIAKFDSSAHMNSTDMTQAEIEAFVEGLDVSGINAVDYIVEQGSNSNGTFRKWNSGVLEQWGHTTIGSNSAATWIYPTPFISANDITMVASCHYLSTATYVAPTISVQPISTDRANVYARVSTSTVTNAHTVSCYAIGKWK